MGGRSFFRKVGRSLTCLAMTSLLVGASTPLQVLAADPALPPAPKKAEPAPKPDLPPAVAQPAASPFTLSFLSSEPFCPEVHTKEDLVVLDIAGVQDSVPANSLLCPSGAPAKSVWDSLFPAPTVPDPSLCLKDLPFVETEAPAASAAKAPVSKTGQKNKKGSPSRTARKTHKKASHSHKAQPRKASHKAGPKKQAAHRPVVARHGRGLAPAVVPSSVLPGYVVMRAAVFANKTEAQTYREMGVPSALAAMAHKRVAEMIGENVKPSFVSVVYKAAARQARLAAISVVAGGKTYTTVFHNGKISPAQTSALQGELHGDPTILLQRSKHAMRPGHRALAHRRALKQKAALQAPVVPQAAPVPVAPPVAPAPAPAPMPVPAPVSQGQGASSAPAKAQPAPQPIPPRTTRGAQVPLPLRAPGQFF